MTKDHQRDFAYGNWLYYEALDQMWRAEIWKRGVDIEGCDPQRAIERLVESSIAKGKSQAIAEIDGE